MKSTFLKAIFLSLFIFNISHADILGFNYVLESPNNTYIEMVDSNSFSIDSGSAYYNGDIINWAASASIDIIDLQNNEISFLLINTNDEINQVTSNICNYPSANVFLGMFIKHNGLYRYQKWRAVR